MAKWRHWQEAEAGSSEAGLREMAPGEGEMAPGEGERGKEMEQRDPGGWTVS